jgi:type I restriction enzyme M protein
VINKLSSNGIAGIVLANGAMTSNSGGENEIRKNMILDGVIDCMVALPTQLFFNTQIPACLFFLARNRTKGKYRNRKDEILFIDARKSGALVSRKNKEFTDEDITKISEVYHNWRSKEGKYEDIQGFCKSAKIKEVQDNNFVLTPGRYVGTEDIEDDGISFEDKIAVISENLKAHFEQSIQLQERIKLNLKKVGIEI